MLIYLFKSIIFSSESVIITVKSSCILSSRLPSIKCSEFNADMSFKSECYETPNSAIERSYFNYFKKEISSCKIKDPIHVILYYLLLLGNTTSTDSEFLIRKFLKRNTTVRGICYHLMFHTLSLQKKSLLIHSVMPYISSKYHKKILKIKNAKIKNLDQLIENFNSLLLKFIKSKKSLLNETIINYFKQQTDKCLLMHSQNYVNIFKNFYENTYSKNLRKFLRILDEIFIKNISFNNKKIETLKSIHLIVSILTLKFHSLCTYLFDKPTDIFIRPYLPSYTIDVLNNAKFEYHLYILLLACKYEDFNRNIKFVLFKGLILF
ncbi:hypothetical protein TUBRATIS_15570, partial [Tubulinosema ratisbonensis]